MIRIIACLLVMNCIAAAPAAPAPPASRPASRPAKPQADLVALHVKAVELMRQGDFRKAGVEFDKVYTVTPASKRNRALVLNRAIIDLRQKTFVMRGIKDLTEYLTKNRDPDEHATNILGGALNIAVVENPKLKSGALWQAAFREWDRRNYVLDHSRKGWRRWGTRWVTADEYAQVQADIAALKQAVEDQRQVASRAYDRARAISQQYTNALDAREKSRYLVQYLQWYNGTYNLPPNLNSDASSPNYGQFEAPRVIQDYTAAYMEAQRLGPEVATAMRELGREEARLRELEGKVIRPQWPTTFEPVDPAGAEADQPATTMPAATTEPAAKEKEFIPGFKPLPPPR